LEVAALAISALSAVWAIVGTWLSNKRSLEALRESRRAADAALWADVQAAVQRLIGFDPATEPIGERLANLRISLIALVDALSEWEGLDIWLEAERALGAALGRQVMEKSEPTDSVEERLKILDPYQLWAQALSSNLRRFRSVGYDAGVVAQLRSHAELNSADTYRANGWAAPPQLSDRIRPLDSL
jgi:hypothetical protein